MVDDNRVHSDVPISGLLACLVACLPRDPAGEGDAAAEAQPGPLPRPPAAADALPGSSPKKRPGLPPPDLSPSDPPPPDPPPAEPRVAEEPRSAGGPRSPGEVPATAQGGSGRRSLAGSDAAAQRLVGLLPFIESVIRRGGVPARDAPDVAHDLLIKLLPWASRLESATLRPPCPTCRGYIRVAATRSAWGHRRREVQRGEILGWTPPGPADERDDGLAPARSPEDLMLEQEAAARLTAELDLDRLSRATSPACWRAFVAYHVGGTPVAEIAEAEEAPIPTIYNRLRIARLDLRAAILRHRAADHGQ